MVLPSPVRTRPWLMLSDADRFRVRAAFIAWKTSTYLTRQAPRDLWDLAALAEVDGFTRESGRLFTTYGPLTVLPSESTIPAAPREDLWTRDLAHQTRLRMTAVEARTALVHAWAAVADEH